MSRISRNLTFCYLTIALWPRVQLSEVRGTEGMKPIFYVAWCFNLSCFLISHHFSSQFAVLDRLGGAA